MKSKLEQNAILSQYKIFLKNLNSNIQIIISSKKTDISYHLEEIMKNSNENSQIQEMSEDYSSFIRQIVREKGAIVKEIFIVLEEKENNINEINTIFDYLNNCGNEVEKCTSEDIKDLLKNYTNKRIKNLI